jgi:hypothetical protein
MGPPPLRVERPAFGFQPGEVAVPQGCDNMTHPDHIGELRIENAELF